MMPLKVVVLFIFNDTLYIVSDNASDHVVVKWDNKGSKDYREDDTLSVYNNEKLVGTVNYYLGTRFQTGNSPFYVDHINFRGNGGDDTFAIQGNQLPGRQYSQGFDYTDVTADGGDGNDRLEGANGRDNLKGGDGNDKLAGNTGYDMLYGELGDDELDGGKDGIGDWLVGGKGKDKFKSELKGVSVIKNIDKAFDFSSAEDSYV